MKLYLYNKDVPSSGKIALENILLFTYTVPSHFTISENQENKLNQIIESKHISVNKWIKSKIIFFAIFWWCNWVFLWKFLLFRISWIVVVHTVYHSTILTTFAQHRQPIQAIYELEEDSLIDMTQKTVGISNFKNQK